MATYEWACDDCKVKWSREYKMGASPVRTKCPECMALSNRIFYATPTHFKGHGWYDTDYKDKRSDQDCKEFYKNAFADSKKRMKSGHEHYKKFTLTKESFDERVRDGSIVKTGEEEAREGAKVAHEVVKQAFKVSGLDPEKYGKSKPQ